MIIGRATGEEIVKYLESLTSEERDIKSSQVQDLCESYHPHIEYKQEFYYIKKKYSETDIRESIVQIATIEGLEEFYRKLFKIIPIRFDIPFPHITLYTTSTREDKKTRGIGIYSEKEFSEINPRRIP